MSERVESALRASVRKVLEETKVWLGSSSSLENEGPRAVYYAILKGASARVGCSLPFPVPALDSLNSPVEAMRGIAEDVLKEPALLDSLYEELVTAEFSKEHGQFITPEQVARFMVNWGIDSKLSGTVRICDPAVGPGIFLDEAARALGQMGVPFQLRGYDVDPLMLDASFVRLAIRGVAESSLKLTLESFPSVSQTDEKYDLMVCNPPYLNFHDFERDKLIGSIERRFGIELSRLTNLYALFFIQTLLMAAEGARVAFITPSEFLYTGYGQQLKEFLLQHFRIKAMILVDFDQSVFEKALTTALVTLLIRERPSPADKVSFVRVRRWPSGENSILGEIVSGRVTSAQGDVTVNHVEQLSLRPDDKWQKHFEPEKEGAATIDRKLVSLSQIAEVSRGIATGYNAFFVLSREEVEKWGIEERFLRPVLHKARQCPWYDFDHSDFSALEKSGEKVFLLYCFEEPSENLLRYIAYGEDIGAHKRFLTSHRRPWYSMERQDPASILATVFSRENMRFIQNRAGVFNLAAFHRIHPRVRDETHLKALLAYLNSGIFEEKQRLSRREYGGGLHKFEPGDLERVSVLDVERQEVTVVRQLALLFDELCQVTRSSPGSSRATKSRIDDILRQA